MSKMPIEWHKECLKNVEAYIESERRKIDSIMASYKKSLSQSEFYKMQIAHAEKEGKDGFDSERYKVKKPS